MIVDPVTNKRELLMFLTTEDGTELVNPSSEQLKEALSRLGLPGNGFAILSQDDQVYIQTSGSRSDGYVVEYRTGNETEHFSSQRDDISHKEMVEIFIAYGCGKPWKDLILWKKWGAAGRRSHHQTQSKESKANKIVIVLMLTIGMSLIFFGASRIIQTHKFLQRAIQVPGTVVGISRTTTKRSYRPIVEYRDQEGRVQKLVGSTGTSSPSYYVGEKVVVLYDPTDTDYQLRARIDAFDELWGLGMVMIFVGSVFGGISGAYWWYLFGPSAGKSRRSQGKSAIEGRR